jgi:hypothetical protein
MDLLEFFLTFLDKTLNFFGQQYPTMISAAKFTAIEKQRYFDCTNVNRIYAKYRYRYKAGYR